MAKDVKARIIPKSETLNDWRKSGYIPKAGEILTVQGNPSFVIVGDGETSVKNLPVIGIGDSLLRQYTESNIDQFIADVKNSSEDFYGYLSYDAIIFEDKAFNPTVSSEDQVARDSDFYGLFYCGKKEFSSRVEEIGNKDVDTNYQHNINERRYIYFYNKSLYLDLDNAEFNYINNKVEIINHGEVYNLEDGENIVFTRLESLEESLSNEIERSVQRDNTLGSNLEKEIADRISEDARIEAKLDSEIARSTGIDENHTTDIKKNKDAIDSEIARATAAEKSLTDSLNKEAEERKASDNSLSTRLGTVETKLDTVSNVMDFVGAFETKPDVANYNDGDVIVITSGEDEGKEFVLSNRSWVELGDTSAEQAAISQLQKDVETVNSEIVTVKEDIKTNYVTNTKLTEELNKFEFDVNIDYGTKEELEAVPNPQEGDIFLLRDEDEGGSDGVTTNPDEIIFPQGTEFLFTKPIGTVTQEDIEDGNGSTTRDASGMSITSFLASLFAEEENPTTPSTSASITSSNIGAKEVGEKIAVAYSFSTSAGSYKFGPENGVVFSNYSATFNGETLTTSSGTFKEVQVIDGMSLVITGSCSQSAGNIPVTNFGKEYPDAQIPEKEWTNLSKGTLTGYRAWLCGYKDGTNSLDDPTAITGEQIRALGNSANGSWKSSMSVTKMKQMFFAAPKGKGYKPVIKDASTTAPQTVLGPIVVSVPGANNYTAIDYDVWYVNNAEAASGSATLKITKS